MVILLFIGKPFTQPVKRRCERNSIARKGADVPQDMKKQVWLILTLGIVTLCSQVSLSYCTPPELTTRVTEILVPAASTAPTASKKTRLELIPSGAIKMGQLTDQHPPILHSSEFHIPVPLKGDIYTAGAEDSPFVTLDGRMMFFFFTPDAHIPPEKQLLDGVTGIYLARKTGETYKVEGRLMLIESGQLALDGAPFLSGESFWFASARKGNFRGVDMWRAVFENGRFKNWQNAGRKLNQEYQIGEMHISQDGRKLYFHSDRAGGKGGYDIWVSNNVDGVWQEPQAVTEVNTPETEGWPFLTGDGNQLWFTRFYLGTPAVFRAMKTHDGWGVPELIVSQFAGEPTLDPDGNLYFVHHYYVDGKMIEADIYVAHIKY